jgi:hypothetical protein
MKNKFLLVLLMLLGMQKVTQAQLSCFTSFQNKFMVWDQGMIREIEYLVPTSFKIGKMAIPYIDNSRNFKIYSNGVSKKINDGFTNNYYVSDNLIAYMNAKSLNVWDNGKVTNLSRYCDQFFLGDSLVLFFDGVQKEFKAYYNGDVSVIESYLAGTNTSNMFITEEDKIRITNDMDIASGALTSIKVSDNVAAYINYGNQFRIFYHGNIINQEDYLVNSFDVGRNTVAYVDANREFKVFQKGKTTTLDNFVPYAYNVGDDVVAFVGYDNYFKIYYNDSLYTLGYFQPDFVVKDNVVAFEDASGYFKVFHKGQIYTLESYYPTGFTAAYNSIAYVNRANVLRLFSNGNTYDVTNADIAEWRLDYDVIQYRFGANMYKVFYNGKTY